MLSIIAAISRNHVIGTENKLPWYLPRELQYFRDMTRGRPVIMGRKTYESIGRLLPNRKNIIVTRDLAYQLVGAIVTHSLEEAIKEAQKEDAEPFVIGGGQIYAEAMKFVDTLYITEVDVEIEGDAKFPEIDTNIWKEVSRIKHPKDAENIYDFDCVVYKK